MMPDHPDAIAFAYDKEGHLKKLVPIIGLGRPSKLEWQDAANQLSKPPEAIAEAWESVQRWIDGHVEG